MYNSITRLLSNLFKNKNYDREGVFSLTIFFLIAATIAVLILNKVIAKSNFGFGGFILGCIFSFCVYKFTKSTKISGNLAVANLTFFFFGSSLMAGGIFSGDFISIFIIPLTAYVLVGLRYALFWSIICFMWGLYLFQLAESQIEIDYFRNQTLDLEKAYYLIGACFNICMVIFFLFINQYKNMKLLKNMKQNKFELEYKNMAYTTRTKQLRKTKKDLTRSNFELSQYAQIASHDLREPIKTINTSANLLKLNLLKKINLDNKSDEYINLILSNTLHMEELVRDLLTYSEISVAQNIKLKRHNLNVTVKNVLLSLKFKIEENRIKVIRGNLPVVNAIPSKINQLFQNIISIAIKFKKPDKSLTIIISSKEFENYWQISIKDNGLGIAKQHLNNIFQPFKKIKTNKQYVGSGIGLAICKRIVEFHNGKIWLDSKINEGTTICFTLKK